MVGNTKIQDKPYYGLARYLRHMHRGKVGQRLRTAREKAGMTRDDVVSISEVNISRTTLQNWESGYREASVEAIARLAAIYKINPRDILFGKEEKAEQAQDSGHALVREPAAPYDIDTEAAPRRQDDEKTRAIASKEYALVPLYEVRARADHETEAEKEQTAPLIFERRWIHRELRAQPSDLWLIHVDGESMEPTLRHGDLILIDRRKAEVVPRDGIYVLRMEESLLVKRLQRLPEHKVNASSDNPAYGSFVLSLDVQNEDFAIIGRVVWSGRCM